MENYKKIILDLRKEGLTIKEIQQYLLVNYNKKYHTSYIGRLIPPKKNRKSRITIDDKVILEHINLMILKNYLSPARH